MPCYEALSDGKILIFYPEGSRGVPEKLSEFKSGIARLSRRFPQVPVAPILLYGLGKSLPKGEALLVPFFCDVFVGDAMFWTGDKESFMNELEDRLEKLAAEGRFSAWE